MTRTSIEIKPLSPAVLRDLLKYFEEPARTADQNRTAACEGLRAQGLVMAEASPKPDTEGDAENHYGPMSLFVASGFTVHRPGQHGCVHVRKNLR